MLSSVFQGSAIESSTVECFRAYSSGRLSSVVHWNAFERIPVDCFRAYSSGMLSRMDFWNDILGFFNEKGRVLVRVFSFWFDSVFDLALKTVPGSILAQNGRCFDRFVHLILIHFG